MTTEQHYGHIIILCCCSLPWCLILFNFQYGTTTKSIKLIRNVSFLIYEAIYDTPLLTPTKTVNGTTSAKVEQ